MNELRQRIESQRNQRSPQSGASDFRRDLNERLNRDDIRNRMQPGNGPGNGRSDNDRSDLRRVVLRPAAAELCQPKPKRILREVLLRRVPRTCQGRVAGMSTGVLRSCSW